MTTTYKLPPEAVERIVRALIDGDDPRILGPRRVFAAHLTARVSSTTAATAYVSCRDGQPPWSGWIDGEGKYSADSFTTESEAAAFADAQAREAGWLLLDEADLIEGGSP